MNGKAVDNVLYGIGAVVMDLSFSNWRIIISYISTEVNEGNVLVSILFIKILVYLRWWPQYCKHTIINGIYHYSCFKYEHVYVNTTSVDYSK